MGLSSSIDALLGSPQNQIDPQAKIYGVVPALVTKVNDTSNAKRHNMGMVEVYFPWLQKDSDPNLVKPWARVCMPNCGKDVGMYTVPQVGDEVLVGFEHGDPQFPYVLGSLWNKDHAIPLPTTKKDSQDHKGAGKSAPTYKKVDMGPLSLGGDKGANKTVFWRSRSGHMMIMDDNPGIVRLTHSSGGSTVELDGGAVKLLTGGDIVLNAKDKCAFECIDFALAAGGKITMSAGNDWHAKADGDISLQAGSDLSAVGTASLQLKSAANINFQGGVKAILNGASDQLLNASGSIKAEAAMNLKAGADSDVHLKGSGGVKVQAGMKVDWKSGGSHKVNGGGAINCKANCIRVQ